MSLSNIVGNYLNAWEGHTQLEGLKLQQVVRTIQKATVSEINTEYNVLCRQNLWVDSLVNLFYDEFLERLLVNGTFVISTAWKSVDEWIKNPFVNIWVGFEDSYVITDSDDILANLENFYTLSNDSFSEEETREILRVLINKRIVATAQILDDSIVIISIENKNDPLVQARFSERNPTAPTFKVDAKIYEIGDFNLIRRMLDGLSSGIFDVVDPFTLVRT